jgi:hypothetical protein
MSSETDDKINKIFREVKFFDLTLMNTTKNINEDTHNICNNKTNRDSVIRTMFARIHLEEKHKQKPTKELTKQLILLKTYMFDMLSEGIVAILYDVVNSKFRDIDEKELDFTKSCAIPNNNISFEEYINKKKEFQQIRRTILLDEFAVKSFALTFNKDTKGIKSFINDSYTNKLLEQRNTIEKELEQLKKLL